MAQVAGAERVDAHPTNGMSRFRRRPATTVSKITPRWLPYVIILVPALYVGIFQVFTIGRGLWLSLTDTNLLNPSKNLFVGAENYVDIASDDAFLHVLFVTLVYTLGSIVGGILVGLVSAILLNGAFRGRGVARTLVAIPWATPGVAVALVFTWIFNNQFGVLNYGLTQIGILDQYTEWLNNPDKAMLAVLIPTIWQLFPVCALVLLAALQSVPQEVIEAAKQDGADGISVFRHVLLPHIAPTLAVITLLATIWSFRRFELIWLLTQGGPAGATNTLAIEIYRETFQFAHLGKAAAVGVIGLGLSLIVTVIYFALTKRAESRANGG